VRHARPASATSSNRYSTPSCKNG